MKRTFVKRNKSGKSPKQKTQWARPARGRKASEHGSFLPLAKTLTTQMLFLGNDTLVAKQGHLSLAQVLHYNEPCSDSDSYSDSA